ncbi:MAG: pentapeptide repeat-containing protein [Proteobacteria bacterium]|nr:pentapeptide repeat-containing protein [Pseudomonadota bacterium]
MTRLLVLLAALALLAAVGAGANLTDARLTKANLTNAELTHADLTGADIEDARRLE